VKPLKCGPQGALPRGFPVWLLFEPQGLVIVSQNPKAFGFAILTLFRFLAFFPIKSPRAFYRGNFGVLLRGSNGQGFKGFRFKMPLFPELFKGV